MLELNLIVAGALIMGYVVVAMFFLRSWRRTGDRFFAFFAGAFALLAVSRLALAVVDEANEGRGYLYLLRLGAFVVLLVAVIDKNRARSNAGDAARKPR